ncbi:761ba4a2-ba63-49a7-9924-660d230d1c14 [Sclerotinia trifoliorum]|uniref:761ba4a2-ba63-49a7-9924-660d230d1c14 n=1 Tax=Sclerotinia trifoliorum TaxID=28548 RepID=A0A8H2VQ24_9HELO|nr:761ba4a2-ba63-49a7-9924-660d230d1c14 [Sclerotinia trifoliorum]
MPSSFSNDVESCATKEFGIMTRTKAVDIIINRTKSLERLLVHRNPVSWEESQKVGIEDELDRPAVLKADFRRRQMMGKPEYEFEDIALKHRQIIAMVNRGLNNLFRYTLEARLQILNEHREEFQMDIKTIEEYLFLLQKLEPVQCKGWAQKISIASKMMNDSTIMRTNIEARIQEVEDFHLDATTEKLNREIRAQMVIDLGVRRGTYGNTLSLRDHEKHPQLKYRELINVESMREQSKEDKGGF